MHQIFNSSQVFKKGYGPGGIFTQRHMVDGGDSWENICRTFVAVKAENPSNMVALLYLV